MSLRLTSIEVRPIGVVASMLSDPQQAQPQGDEGAPDALLVIDEAYREALEGLAVGDRIIVLTWLDRAARDVLSTIPRGDCRRPAQGVFSTRSPSRPNPIGLQEVQVLAIDGRRLRVNDMEALDGTPVLDIKPVLPAVGSR